MCCPFIWLLQVVWQPYEAELAHLPAFCVAGRDVWTARVPFVCFWLVEKHTPDRVVRQFGMVQEIPPYVDTDDALHDIDLRGKIEVNWREKHYGHIQVWNTKARTLCHGVRLEGDMSPAHPYFDWYDRVTWRFVDHTTASLLIMVIATTFLFKFCCVPPFLHGAYTNCIYLLAGCQSQAVVDAACSR